MKKKKNRRKLLRTKCQNCNAVEYSLQAACPRCDNAFFQNDSLDILEEITLDVESLEDLLKTLEVPGKAKGNPYEPVDLAFKLLRKLRSHSKIPGMTNYIAQSRAVLLPYKVSLLRSTYKANIILLFVLFAFPLLPLILGWSPTVVLLMGLPVVAWSLITYRARRDLRRAEQDAREANQ